MTKESGLNIDGRISPEAQQRSNRPANFGPLKACDAHARITGSCGDTMEFWIEVADGRVAKVTFITTGCGPSRAAGSMATELAQGKTLEEANRIEQADILRALGGLPVEFEHCALLASNTLKKAIEDYHNRATQSGTQECEHCSSTQCTSKQRRPDESAKDYRERQALDERMSQIGYKLLVMSGKGGVGKSTVATNLAVSLALAGKSVGLLDVDIHGPSIPQLVGLDGERVVFHGKEIVPLQIGENLKVMSIGFLLGSREDAVIWRGPMKYGVIQQFLRDVDWGELDYLIIDAPPGTGDEPLSVVQLAGQPAGALLVSTPQQLAVSDVRRSVSFCQKLSLPVLGIIENMSGLICPHCGGEIDLFKNGGGEELATEMNVSFLGRVPIDPQIVQCGDSGSPYVHHFADSVAAKAFADIVGRILENRV